MKKIYLFILTSFILYSCQNTAENTSEPITEETKEDINPKPVIEEEEPTTSTDDEYTYYEFKGSLEGDIPIEIHLNVFGELIQGELFYKKVGKPIRVIGGINEDDYWSISEFAADGNITGLLTGNFKEQKDLTWYSPATRKRRKMDLTLEQKTKKTTVISLFKTDKIIGKYSYQYGEEGPLGNLEVKEAEGDSVYLDLVCLTHAPGRNIASVEETTLYVKDDKISIIYGERGDEFTDCAFDINFYKDFVFIDYIDNRTQCEFGHNAYVSGIFSRVE